MVCLGDRAWLRSLAAFSLAVVVGAAGGCSGDPDESGFSGGGTVPQDGGDVQSDAGDGPCFGVTCSGHGTCFESKSQAVCVCDPGFRVDGLNCRAIGECGNGLVEPGEYCDPGAGGVSFDCTSLSLKYASGTATCSDSCTIDFAKCVSAGTCGNGVIEQGEQCDDGNVVNGDGCSATCADEAPTENGFDCATTEKGSWGATGDPDPVCDEPDSAAENAPAEVNGLRVRFHVATDPSGQRAVDEAGLDSMIADANARLAFANVGIIAYGATADLVDTSFYNMATWQFSALVGIDNDPDAIDVYVVHTWPGLCGRATDIGPLTDGLDAVVMVAHCGGATLAHELGHVFGLWHTHHLQTGDLCDSTGDSCCDTAVDPGPASAQNESQYPTGPCTNAVPPACASVCPGPETPPVRNVMSYYGCGDELHEDNFTACQSIRARCYLARHYEYARGTIVSPPVCGDMKCEGAEPSTCPEDCEGPGCVVSAPLISSAGIGTVGNAVSIDVTRGSDSCGEQTKVHCVSLNSNYSDSGPYVSTYGDGSTSVVAEFIWNTAGSKIVYCTTFRADGTSSSETAHEISIAEPVCILSAPTVDAPSSGDVDSVVSVDVVRGTDSCGEQTKVQCTSEGSNFEDSSPFISSYGTGGSPLTAGFSWTTPGTKSVYCTTFKADGTASSTATDTISISAPSCNLSAPTVNAPASGTTSSAVSVSVVRGTDSCGAQTKVHCTSVGSNYTDSGPFISSYGTGGSAVTASFTWATAGTKTVYCTTFKADGTASATATDTISISAPTCSVSAPTVDAPATGTTNSAVNVFVVRGTDSCGEQTKVHCTSVGSNYTDSSPFVSSYGTGGTVSASFSWTTTGTKTVYCTAFKADGTASGTATDTIIISAPTCTVSAPAVDAPPTGTMNSAVSVFVVRGTDSCGEQTKVHCTSVGSNYTDSSPFVSSYGTGGTVSAGFSWTTTGTKTVYCTAFKADGTASGTATDTIIISAPTCTVSAPAVDAPPTGTTNSAVSVFVVRGTDSCGEQTKVHCTSVGSNYTDSSPFISSYGTGGTVSASFSWTTTGTKTVYCTAFKADGTASATATDTISVSAPTCSVSAPTVDAPPSGTTGNAVSVSVVRGTDSCGEQTKVHCTSVGSNYTDSSPFISSYDAGGTTTTASFTWATTGTKTVYCTAFKADGTASSTATDTISISAPSCSLSAPTVNAPTSGTTNTAVSVSVVRGTDSCGEQTKVHCTSVGSNYTDSSPFISIYDAGGTTTTASFTWATTGTKTVYCTAFKADGTASSTATDTISISAPSCSLSAPTVNAPTSGTTNTAVSVSVVRGTDSCGEQTKVHCTSVGSNYTDSSPFISSYDAGGTTTTASFTWATTGTKTVYCTAFKADGTASSTATDTISISAPSCSLSAPTVNAPSSGTTNTAVSVSVVRGTDSCGEQTKVHCTSVGSNYTDSSPFISSYGAGGTTTTASFTWATTGTKTVYCTAFKADGTASSTATDTISISAPSCSLSAPTVNAPSTGTTNTAVSVSVVRGTDSCGAQTKVHCTSVGSNYTDSNPFISSYGAGGTTTTASFTWATTGTKTVYCTAFKADGTASSTATDTISISAPSCSLSAPTVNAPASGTRNVAVSVSVVRGTDSCGAQTKVHCASPGSNYPDASPYISSYGNGGTTVTTSFIWGTAGTKTVYCTAFKADGTSSSTATDTISIN